mmetsp:Transcript_50467/g.100426  ORF Transcript_50467/g.100426 Transcript_50467/m.100426 type:complete len:139 (+) Transcript_50467:103-519(+)
MVAQLEWSYGSLLYKFSAWLLNGALVQCSCDSLHLPNKKRDVQPNSNGAVAACRTDSALVQSMVACLRNYSAHGGKPNSSVFMWQMWPEMAASPDRCRDQQPSSEEAHSPHPHCKKHDERCRGKASQRHPHAYSEHVL